MLVAPEDVLTVVGETVQFDCRFAGDPTPSVVWYYKEEEDSNPQGPITDGDGWVMIGVTRLTMWDTGLAYLYFRTWYFLYDLKQGHNQTFKNEEAAGGSEISKVAQFSGSP